MKPLFKLTTLIFGVLSGLFIFNRFYDLFAYVDLLIRMLIVAYCCHTILILAIGLLLFSKQKQIGFWMLMLFSLFIIVRHGIIYFQVMLTAYNMRLIPGMMEIKTIPYLDWILAFEIFTGIVTVYLAYKNRCEWKRIDSASK